MLGSNKHSDAQITRCWASVDVIQKPSWHSVRSRAGAAQSGSRGRGLRRSPRRPAAANILWPVGNAPRSAMESRDRKKTEAVAERNAAHPWQGTAAANWMQLVPEKARPQARQIAQEAEANNK